MTAVATLIVLPALVFGAPALFGHPVLPGDDMTQNYPLRVLAGRDIASGRLPLFDPYIWSGSVLLAGWNAGAAYPLTLLFAVLPGVAAWSIGLVLTYAVACVGMYGFLRALGLRSVAGFLGALSFGLAGAMSAQVTHFGLVAGMSWVPLSLLALLRLTPERGASGSAGLRRRGGWAALLATSTGLMILAGDPRAIADGYVIVALYATWRLVRLTWRGAVRAGMGNCLFVGGGLALGLALGAVQWLPGMAAIETSQRGTATLALFSSGSLPVRWLLLTLVPDILGGSGSLSQPSFFATYNLTEVTSYVGILPLVAAFALLARIRLRTRPPEWLIWHVIAVIGALLALGANTPLGAVLYRLPLYGGQRLQSRNIIVLDLAFAVLLAYWADQPFPAGKPVKVPGTLRVRRVRAETLLALLPPFGMLLVVVLGLAWGTGFLRWLGVDASPDLTARLGPWLIPYAVIAVGAGALVVLGRRLRPRAWRRACAAFVVADIVVFSVLAVVSIAPEGSGGASSTPAPRTPDVARTSTSGHLSPAAPPPRPISALGYPGRYAIYDPGLLDTSDLSVLGPPDLNDLDPDGMASVQGYTSLVDGTYATGTGVHSLTGEGQNTLSTAAVANGTLGELDTSILLTLPAYLTTAGGYGTGTSADSGVTAGPAGTGRRDIAAEKDATWYLGESVAVSEIEVPDAHARADAAAGTKIGLTTPAGATRWFSARASNAGTLEVTLPVPMAGTTVVGKAGHIAVALGAPSVIEPGGQVLTADGRLQDALEPPQWDLAGFDGSFAIFTDKLASSPITVQALPGGSAKGAIIRYVNGAGDEPVRATVSSPDGVRLVRSVAAVPRWTALWQPQHGTARALPVRPDGLVQAVDVPAGTGNVTWHYTAPGFTAGLALTLGATLLIGAFALLALTGGRIRRGTLIWRRRNWWRSRCGRASILPGSGWGDHAGDLPRGPSREGDGIQV